MEAIRPAVLVEGDDFNFGAGRAGDVNTLQQLGRDRGFEAVVVPPKQIQLPSGKNMRVSSTLIRYMIEGGHVGEAAAALSRPYRLIGPIISGWGRGRKLGFPTLNMDKPDQIIPAEGVYAGTVAVADAKEGLLQQNERTPAVFSIGQARTFGDQHPLLIEAHLLAGPVGDMTNKWMAMDFVEHLRSQHKFDTPEALVTQIGRDCRRAEAILQNSTTGD
jgi:riboflavin kinase/FMN adenylyltransferase